MTSFIVLQCIVYCGCKLFHLFPTINSNSFSCFFLSQTVDGLTMASSVRSNRSGECVHCGLSIRRAQPTVALTNKAQMMADGKVGKLRLNFRKRHRSSSLRTSSHSRTHEFGSYLISLEVVFFFLSKIDITSTSRWGSFGVSLKYFC